MIDDFRLTIIQSTHPGSRAKTIHGFRTAWYRYPPRRFQVAQAMTSLRPFRVAPHLQLHVTKCSPHGKKVLI